MDCIPDQAIIGERRDSLKTIKSIDKMVALLDIFADHHELSLNEICELTGFPRISAFDTIKTLKVHQFLRQDPLTNKYALGVALLKYGVYSVLAIH